MSEWADAWLNSSGINTLEPVVELENGQLKSLKIKQGLGLKGKNRLRVQKLNVSIYEAAGGGEPVVIRGVVVGDKDELTDVDISELPGDFQFGAAFVNEGEHAYAKVRFDSCSIDWFTENLHSVTDITTRAAMHRYFWMLVMDKKMTSLKYIEFVEKQLPTETVEQILSVCLANLKGLIAYYVPLELVAEKKDVLFNTLVTLLSKEGVNKDAIVDQLFGFLSSKENIQAALGWLETGKITVGDAQLFDITKSHKHTILKMLFRSKDFSTTDKMELLEMTLGDEKSDLGDRTRATCMASLPDPAVKATIWDELTDPANTESKKMKEAKMAGFYSMNQIDILAPYFEKFYDTLPVMQKQLSGLGFEPYFFTLLPRMVVEDRHIVKLVALKQDTPDNEKAFMNLLQDGVELLLRSKQIRELCAQ